MPAPGVGVHTTRPAARTPLRWTMSSPKIARRRRFTPLAGPAGGRGVWQLTSRRRTGVKGRIIVSEQGTTPPWAGHPGREGDSVRGLKGARPGLEARGRRSGPTVRDDFPPGQRARPELVTFHGPGRHPGSRRTAWRRRVTRSPQRGGTSSWSGVVRTRCLLRPQPAGGGDRRFRGAVAPRTDTTRTPAELIWRSPPPRQGQGPGDAPHRRVAARC
ncbi:hypothetical protein QJS66_21760 [Kocuria rhizophila]|nr:hypothetical protein QJS66_21760 [Kocuria rhizophila]